MWVFFLAGCFHHTTLLLFVGKGFWYLWLQEGLLEHYHCPKTWAIMREMRWSEFYFPHSLSNCKLLPGTWEKSCFCEFFCFCLSIPWRYKPLYPIFDLFLSENRKNKIWCFYLKRKEPSAFNITFFRSLLWIILKRAQTNILLMHKYSPNTLILMSTLRRLFLEKTVFILCFR